MNYQFRPENHPRNRLGRFIEVLGALKPGDTVGLPDGVKVERRVGGTYRLTKRGGRRPVDTKSVDYAAKAGLTGLKEMSPQAKTKMTDRVRDSLLSTVEIPRKGPATPGRESMIRVRPAMSPGTKPPVREYRQDASVPLSQYSPDFLEPGQRSENDMTQDEIFAEIRSILGPRPASASSASPMMHRFWHLVSLPKKPGQNPGLVGNMWTPLQAARQARREFDGVPPGSRAERQLMDKLNIRIPSPQSPGTEPSGMDFGMFTKKGNDEIAALIDERTKNGPLDAVGYGILQDEMEYVGTGEAGDTMVRDEVFSYLIDNGLLTPEAVKEYATDSFRDQALDRLAKATPASPQSPGTPPDETLEGAQKALVRATMMRAKALRDGDEASAAAWAEKRQAAQSVLDAIKKEEGLPASPPEGMGMSASDFDSMPLGSEVVVRGEKWTKKLSDTGGADLGPALPANAWENADGTKLFARDLAKRAAVSPPKSPGTPATNDELESALRALAPGESLSGSSGYKVTKLADGGYADWNGDKINTPSGFSYSPEGWIVKMYDGNDVPLALPSPQSPGTDELSDEELAAINVEAKKRYNEERAAEREARAGLVDRFSNEGPDVAEDPEPPESPGTPVIASGDKVQDPATGRTGTFQRGFMSGEPSVVWDDKPDEAEFYYEGELVPLPKAPESPGTTSELADMPLYDLASEIRKDWKNVNFGAKPYLDAMGALGSVDDDYGLDSGRSIVAYFLSNARSWQGDKAKEIKAELKRRMK